MRSLVFLLCFIYMIRLNDGTHYRHHAVESSRRRTYETRGHDGIRHCGKRWSSVPTSRIIGGGPSAPGEWPWMAALYYGRKEGGQWTEYVAGGQCGGSLISDQWVLTAAHCVPQSSYEGDQIIKFVRLGDLDLRDGIRDGAEPIDVPIRRTIRHSRYRARTYENDIALLRLDRKVKFTKYIYPICLLSGSRYMADKYYHEKVGTVAGWGVTDTHEKELSHVLRHVDVRFGDCKRNSNIAVLDGRFLCAGDTESDSCQGDSGGPLMIENTTTGLYYQAGIVAFGKGCAEKYYPGMYRQYGRKFGIQLRARRRAPNL